MSICWKEMKNLIEFDFLAFVLVKHEIWPPVPVWGKKKKKRWSNQNKFLVLMSILKHYWTLIFVLISRRLLKRLNLTAAGETNLRLLQHYRRSLIGRSVWHGHPVTFVTSCLSMRFYVFIWLTFFSYCLDNCWFTVYGWLIYWLLPSAVHSRVCWPSQPYTGVDFSWLYSGLIKPPHIHQLD